MLCKQVPIRGNKLSHGRFLKCYTHIFSLFGVWGASTYKQEGQAEGEGRRRLSAEQEAQCGV